MHTELKPILRCRKRKTLSEIIRFFLPASASTQSSVPSGVEMAGFFFHPLLHLQASPIHSFSLPLHVVWPHAENRERYTVGPRDTRPQAARTSTKMAKNGKSSSKNAIFTI